MNIHVLLFHARRGRYTASLFLAVLLLSFTGIGQEYVYVNTNNLLLRDRPTKPYNVWAVLHAPCRLKVEQFDRVYMNDKTITARFYQVGLRYTDEWHYSHYFGGLVDKRYVVTDTSMLKGDIKNKGLALNASLVPIEPTYHNKDITPEDMNWWQFPGPVYKGGDPMPPPVRRVYHRGPRGGCYYYSKAGKKVYVEKSVCQSLFAK